METAQNPKSLRTVLGESPVVAEVVSLHDLPDMGGEDFVVVLVKIGEDFYADTVIVEGEKIEAGAAVEFTADAEGSFPHAKVVPVPEGVGEA